MEVHHHAHPSTSSGHRKKWTHYFWEFLMLFLAVTLGFFVENQREHYVENKRAKEYARLLTDDLEADLAEFNRAERVLHKIISAGDSLAHILSEPDLRNVPGGKIYYYEYWSGWRWNVISRDATLQQLKNSGSLRYLHNTSLVRKILDYEESIRIINMLQNKYEPEKDRNWNMVQRVFYQDYFNILDADPQLARDSALTGFAPDSHLDSFTHSNYPLFNYNREVIFELKNWAYNSSRNYRVIMSSIKTARLKAKDLIDALNQEYL